MKLPGFVAALSPTKQAITAIVVVAIAAFGAGGTVTHLLAQQAGLPSVVQANRRGLERLEVRVEEVEAVLSDLEETAESFVLLNARVDSLFVMEAETYCLVRAHTYGLDPDVACQETRRHDENCP